MESTLRETWIDSVKPVSSEQSARIEAYHQLALNQSSADSDATNQDVSII